MVVILKLKIMHIPKQMHSLIRIFPVCLMGGYGMSLYAWIFGEQRVYTWCQCHLGVCDMQVKPRSEKKYKLVLSSCLCVLCS